LDAGSLRVNTSRPHGPGRQGAKWAEHASWADDPHRTQDPPLSPSLSRGHTPPAPSSLENRRPSERFPLWIYSGSGARTGLTWLGPQPLLRRPVFRRPSCCPLPNRPCHVAEGPDRKPAGSARKRPQAASSAVPLLCSLRRHERRHGRHRFQSGRDRRTADCPLAMDPSESQRTRARGAAAQGRARPGGTRLGLPALANERSTQDAPANAGMPRPWTRGRTPCRSRTRRRSRTRNCPVFGTRGLLEGRGRPATAAAQTSNEPPPRQARRQRGRRHRDHRTPAALWRPGCPAPQHRAQPEPGGQPSEARPRPPHHPGERRDGRPGRTRVI